MRYSMVFSALCVLCELISTQAAAKPLLRFSGKQGQPVSIAAYSYTLPVSSPLAVDFSFGKEEARRLRDLMQANVGSQVAVRIGDQAATTPTVRAVPQGDSLELTLDDAKSFEAVKAALSQPDAG